MGKLDIKACPICKSTSLKQHINCTDFYATGERFSIKECCDCGFRMTDGAPVEAEIGRYYETPDYISHSDTHKGLMNKVYHHVRQYMLRKKVRMVVKASGKQTGSLLDYGTGTGYFPNAMKQAGWSVSAIEKSAQAREFAKSNFGIDVVAESEFDNLAADQFDVITLWHVMEHVENLDHLWENISRCLRPGGTLIVAVPNCSSADEAIYKEHWAAYDVPRHLWHFVPKTMNLLASQKGYTLKQELPMPFDAFYVSMLSEKYLGRKSYFLRGMISGARALAKAVGNKRLSSSIIYIFKKND